VLAEIKRVLRPGGTFILAEMVDEPQTEAERTSVQLHRWAARVDTAMGRLHNPTLTRQALLDHVATLGLSQVELFDSHGRDLDPMDGELLAHLDAAIERWLPRAETADPSGELKRQGEALHQRLKQFGACGEPVLVVIGKN